MKSKKQKRESKKKKKLALKKNQLPKEKLKEIIRKRGYEKAYQDKRRNLLNATRR